MAGVSFDEEPVTIPLPAAEQPQLVRLVMRWGLADSQKGAELLLLSVAVAGFVTMFILLFLQMGKGTGEYRTPDQLRAERGFTTPIPVPR